MFKEPVFLQTCVKYVSLDITALNSTYFNNLTYILMTYKKIVRGVGVVFSSILI